MPLFDLSWCCDKTTDVLQTGITYFTDIASCMTSGLGHDKGVRHKKRHFRQYSTFWRDCVFVCVEGLHFYRAV